MLKKNFPAILFSLYFFILAIIFTSLKVKLETNHYLILKILTGLNFIGILTLFFYLIKKQKSRFPIGFLILIPAEIVYLIAFYFDNFFNKKIIYEPYLILINGYLIAILVFLVFGLRLRSAIIKSSNVGAKNFWPLQWNNFKKNRLDLIIIGLVIIFNLSFGFFHLSKNVAVDEALWTNQDGRIIEYWSNIADLELWKTRVSDKPGITLTFLSGLGLPFLDESDLAKKSTAVIPSPEKVNLAFRTPLLIFSALMLIVFFFLLKKLFNRKTALIATIFIGLSPILLGISTIVNPDGLIWIFTPLSIISFLIFNKDKNNKYLYLTGIFLGLALLTKYISNLLYIYFLFLIYFNYFINPPKKPKKDSFNLYLKENLKNYFIIVLTSIITFFVFLPEAWVDLTKLLESTLFSEAFQKIWPLFLSLIAFIVLDTYLLKSKITLKILNFLIKYKKIILNLILSLFLILILITLINTYLGMPLYNFEEILTSPKSSFKAHDFLGMILANFYSLIFGIHPLALLGILALVFNPQTWRSRKDMPWHVPTIALIVFILTYYFASTINKVGATTRYQIVIFPIAFILASVGLLNLIKFIKTKNPHVVRERREVWGLWPAVIALLIAASVYSLNFIKPFYFSYSSLLLPPQYISNLKTMGNGSYEASWFLNQLPDAEKITIWTDKRGVCTFFKGTCLDGEDYQNRLDEIDYFVISSDSESRTKKILKDPKLQNLYDHPSPAFHLKIGGREGNFVKVIEND
jgi:hypothetical protein